MTSQPEWMDELTSLCDALIEGSMSETQRARLEQLVLADAAARSIYVELMHQQATLSWALVEPGALQSSPESQPVSEGGTIPFQAARHSNLWRRRAAYALSTAAALLLGIWFGWSNLPRPGETSIATLVEARDCTWKSGALATEAGAKLTPGRLQLVGGLARLQFAQGAEVSLEAPADLELVSASRCILHAGRLVAKVPPQAIGFVVETREAILRDLGTEFGVSVSGTGAADMQVFDGLVDVEPRVAGGTRRVTAGHGLQIDHTEIREYGTSEEPAPPASVEPAGDSEVVQITTVTGHGKESCVQSVWPLRHTSDVLMLLKNDSNPASEFQRKGYLGFDLTALRGRKLADAQLRLVFEPTQMGYASRHPQGTFAVYGLVDESLDDWQESTIRWENAPANGPGGAGIDTSKVVLLGRFVVEPNRQHAVKTVSGPALTDFLNRDTNGQATLIVLRETVYGGKDSLVHGFANRRHPDSPGPTLKLKLAEPSR
jgi:ferric-dicitrate binding protein FerR (iron transport regulator)